MFFLTGVSFAHSGGLDAEGGHFDHQKQEYHYHKDGKIIVDPEKTRRYHELAKDKMGYRGDKGRSKKKSESIEREEEEKSADFSSSSRSMDSDFFFDRPLSPLYPILSLASS